MAPNPFLQALEKAKESSPQNKRAKAAETGADKHEGRAKSDTGADKQEGRAVYSLSCLELTRAFLDHDLQLRQLQASVTVVYKFDEKRTLCSATPHCCSGLAEPPHSWTTAPVWCLFLRGGFGTFERLAVRRGVPSASPGASYGDP